MSMSEFVEFVFGGKIEKWVPSAENLKKKEVYPLP
jgi:hypothetical protein